jgi:hypothetical protein
MKKTRVTYRFDPSFAISGPVEDYKSHGIELTADGNQITHIAAIVEQDEHDQPRYEEVVLLARDRIVPFLGLLGFITGRTLKLGEVEATPLNYPGFYVVASCSTPFESLGPRGNVHPLLPATKLVAKLTPELAQQLAWFNAGESAQWSVERIRNYYEVLELEKELRPAYKPPDECRWLRHAVSHPRLTDPKVTAYLQASISSSFIDPNDDSHLRFLEEKVKLLRAVAYGIIDPQLRV